MTALAISKDANVECLALTNAIAACGDNKLRKHMQRRVDLLRAKALSSSQNGVSSGSLAGKNISAKSSSESEQKQRAEGEVENKEKAELGSGNLVSKEMVAHYGSFVWIEEAVSKEVQQLAAFGKNPVNPLVSTRLNARHFYAEIYTCAYAILKTINVNCKAKAMICGFMDDIPVWFRYKICEKLFKEKCNITATPTDVKYQNWKFTWDYDNNPFLQWWHKEGEHLAEVFSGMTKKADSILFNAKLLDR